MSLTAEQEAEARRMWEKTDLSAKKIGGHFGVSLNTIIGLSFRRKWTARRPRNDDLPIPTTLDRMDALHAEMDRVLAETEPAIRGVRRMLSSQRRTAL